MKFNDWIEKHHDELWEEWLEGSNDSFSVFRLKKWQERENEE